jgi:hypothetical protein
MRTAFGWVAASVPVARLLHRQDSGAFQSPRRNLRAKCGGMGLIWPLVVIVLVLGAAALIKYLFFSGPPRPW